MAKRKRSRRDKFLEALTDKRDPVVVVRTPPGISKTVEVCRKLANYWPEKKIVVSHPYRIVVERYGQQLAEVIDSGRVGWRWFGDSRSSSTNSQVALRTPQSVAGLVGNDRKLPEVLIIDGISAPDIFNDILLGFVKEYLPHSPNSRVVVVAEGGSADKLSRSFGDAPIVNVSVPGKLLVETEVFRLLKGEHHTGAAARATNAAIDAFSEGRLSVAGKVADKGTILVLIPGGEEAKNVEKLLAADKKSVTVITCYGQVSINEMEEVCKEPGLGEIRVIVGTRMLRWLDIPELVGIVDTLESKDSADGGMKKRPISRAEVDRTIGCLSHRGGFYFPVSYQDGFKNLRSEDVPLALRASLVGPLLFIAAAGFDVRAFPFVEEPSVDKLEEAIRSLQRYGALDAEAKITPTGRLMRRLPIDPRFAPAVAKGDGIDVFAEVLIVAAVLEARGIHIPSYRRKTGVNDANDFVLIVRLYREFAAERARVSDLTKGGRDRYLESWCSANALELKGLEAVHAILKQTKQVIGGLYDFAAPRDFSADDLTRALLLCLSGSVGVRTGAGYERAAGGTFELPGYSGQPPVVLAEGVRKLPSSPGRPDIFVAGVSAPVELGWLEELPGFEITPVGADIVEICFGNRLLGYVSDPGGQDGALHLERAYEIREQIKNLLDEYGARLSSDLVRRLASFTVNDNLLPGTPDGLRRWIEAAEALIEEAQPTGEASKSSLARLLKMYGKR